MKKKSIFRIIIIIIAIIAILLITTLFYRIYQVNNFQKDLRQTTIIEKQQIIEILNQNMNITGYEIIFGNVFTKENATLVQVQLKKDGLKKSYLINLENKSLVSRNFENETFVRHNHEH
jgi:hypothetical protein